MTTCRMLPLEAVAAPSPGPTLAMAVDTTCSMALDMKGVINGGIAMVNSRLDTDDEPLKYVLSQFNDPSVGPVTVTDDPDAFKAALGSLDAEGSGGDCPEYSMYGLLNAVAASDDVLPEAPPNREALGCLPWCSPARQSP